MNLNIVNMLEDIKTDRYQSYQNYLSAENMAIIHQWFLKFTTNQSIDFQKIIDLMYQLYIREDIDSRPYEEYIMIVSTLAEEYYFNVADFLSLYNQFRQIVFDI